jgi:hypothetical protein
MHRKTTLSIFLIAHNLVHPTLCLFSQIWTLVMKIGVKWILEICTKKTFSKNIIVQNFLEIYSIWMNFWRDPTLRLKSKLFFLEKHSLGVKIWMAALTT